MYHIQENRFCFNPGLSTDKQASRKISALNTLFFLLIFLLTSACSQSDAGSAGTGATATEATGFIGAPELVANPGGRVPLAAVIRFNAGPGVSCELTITDGAHTWSAGFDDSMERDGSYRIPVVGMRPDREHGITLELSAPDGATETHRFTHRTPPLPENPLEIPPFAVKVSRPDLMEPGRDIFERAAARPWATPLVNAETAPIFSGLGNTHSYRCPR